MRIALILSGQPRSLSKCLPGLKKYLIEPNTPDIFYHTWWDRDLIGKPFDSAQPHQIGTVGKWSPDTDDLLDSIEYTSRLVEKPMDFEISKHMVHAPTANQNSMCSIFYSQWKAGMLKKEYEQANNFVYDVVIRARFDLVYDDYIIVEKLDVQKGTLILAAKWQDIREVFIPGLGDYTMDDNIAIGKSEDLDNYLNVFPNILRLNGIVRPPFAENYLGWYCKKENSLKTVTHDFKLEIAHRL